MKLLVVFAVLFVVISQCHGHAGLWYTTTDQAVEQFGTETRIDLRPYNLSFPVKQIAVVLDSPAPLLFVEDALKTLYRVIMKAPYPAQKLSVSFTSWSLSRDQKYLYFTNPTFLSRCGLNGQGCANITCALGPEERFVALLDANTTTAFALKEYSEILNDGTIKMHAINLNSPSLECSKRIYNEYNEPFRMLRKGEFVIQDSAMLRFTTQEIWFDQMVYSTVFSADLNRNVEYPTVICSSPFCPVYSPFYFSAMKKWGLILVSASTKVIYILADPPNQFTLEPTGVMPLTADFRTPAFFETSKTLPGNVGCPNYCSLNGYCVNATCQCAANYYAEDCSVYCRTDATCSSHGTCNANGGCDCSLGWSGANCDKYSPFVPPVFPPNFAAKGTFQGDEVNATVVSDIEYSSTLQFLRVDGESAGVLRLYEYGVQYTYTNSTCSSSLLSQSILPTISTPPDLYRQGVPCGADKCDVFGNDPSNRIWFISQTKKPFMVVRNHLTMKFDAFAPQNFSSTPSAPSWCDSSRRFSISVN